MLSAVAQEPVPKTVNGGVLNGKAVSLPKPPYPAAARAVGASGAVTVQVLIDENGNVASASAVSGHPLLRAASVQAAQAAKFSPTTLSGNPVKVAGVITYNFVPALSLARIAFTLSHADQTGLFGRYSSAESMASDLPTDWVQEREILSSLTFEEATPLPPPAPPDRKPMPQKVEPPPPPDAKNRYTIVGAATYSASGVMGSYAGRKLDTKSLDALRSLLSLVETRASVNESSAWTFELGRALAVLVADIYDETKFQSDLSNIESLLGRAPAGVRQPSLEQARELVEYSKKDGLTAEDRLAIISKAEMLTNLRY